MSTFPKLDINIRDLTNHRLQFDVPKMEKPPKEPPPFYKYIFIVVLAACCIVTWMYAPASRRLRKIIRMSCTETQSEQVCSTYLDGGEYVVNDKCTAYEFNGIPFIELVKTGNNYHIPSSPDHTLRMKGTCPNVIATVDTNTVIPYSQTYARQGSIYTHRLVWIASKCYTDFTLRIGDEIVFDNTPIEMLEKKTMGDQFAYTYESTGVSGNIMLSGHGCDGSIRIYSI